MARLSSWSGGYTLPKAAPWHAAKASISWALTARSSKLVTAARNLFSPNPPIGRFAGGAPALGRSSFGSSRCVGPIGSHRRLWPRRAPCDLLLLLRSAPASAAASRASTPSAMSFSASATRASTISSSGTTRTILPFMNRWPLWRPGGDAEVCLPRLSGTVYDTAHDCHLQRPATETRRPLGPAGRCRSRRSRHGRKTGRR